MPYAFSTGMKTRSESAHMEHSLPQLPNAHQPCIFFIGEARVYYKTFHDIPKKKITQRTIFLPTTIQQAARREKKYISERRML